MAELSEKSFPFDSDEINGVYDREYYAEDWMRYFAAFISSGTFLKEPTNLQVIANGDMTVTLKPGSLMIDGARYDNVDDIIIQLDPADGVLSRIDRIAITWSKPDRDAHYTLRKGSMSYEPVAPVCRRTEEYKDYVTADVYVRAGAISISQTDITDQRLNSEVCGLAVPFTDINTTGIFLQLQSFYEQTVATQEEWQAEQEKTITEWFEEIRELLRKENALHEQHKKDLNDYFAGMQQSGSDRLETITQQLIEFRNTNEAEFLAWFEMIKGIFGTDPGGELLLQLNDLTEQVELNRTMITTGKALTRIGTSQGGYITDHMGNPILIGWPICKCNT